MRILTTDNNPIHKITYQSPASGGGIETKTLAIEVATIDFLPAGVDAIFATSDLQGRADNSSDARLLGEALAEQLETLGINGKIPNPDKIGIILGGDFYSRPRLDRRGGKGDVRHVWTAFGNKFRWATGVVGNHDGFGFLPADLENLHKTFSNIHILDGSMTDLDGLKIAGISGIIGNPRKAFRRDAKSYLEEIQRLLKSNPDILVIHEAPYISEGHKGTEGLKEVLLVNPNVLVLCGHRYWAEPLVSLANGPQILNVNSRAFLLMVGK